MNNSDWITKLANNPKRNKKRESNKKKVLNLKIKAKILWKFKNKISKNPNKNKLY